MKIHVFEKLTFKELTLCWLLNITVFGIIYLFLQTTQKTFIENIINAFYLSFTTALTLGNGAFTTLTEKVLVIFEATISIFILGLIIGKIVSIKQDEIIEKIDTLNFEETIQKTITELYILRNQITEKGYKKINAEDIEYFSLLIGNSLKSLNQTKTNNPQTSVMELSLLTASINNSLSKFVELLKEFNKKKTGWKKESITTTILEAKKSNQLLKEYFEKTTPQDQLYKIVGEKLEDLDRTIEELQKSL
ncbi:MAG: potassium channel family protein [Candidatus Woesearchaeota archaeon]